ncbi:hypothetical protein [Sphingomonas sp. SRS2]|uniref:hypothetical protein n=1 Tax=Sphingomonas sp. SRS2 TaxID=133190 RepID=UPI0006184F79|nr:hypothetical protein [Sphingomonas sp. SRS2]KKC25506.1 hypothetical protein WP12_13615 [Sphingomonas sp. SRS2]
MKSLVNVALIATFALSSAAFAADGEKKEAQDPDRLICKSEEIVGSRLAKQKRCLTKAQWAEDRRIQKMAIDRAQTARYKNN